MSKKNLVTETKVVFRFVNKSDIDSLVDYLDDNEISYDEDLADGTSPRFVSFGTSKKFTVGTSKFFDIYKKKGFTSFSYVDSLNPSAQTLDNVLSSVFVDNTPITVTLDEVNLEDDEEDDNTIYPDDDTIIALYNKVKKQKKSPKNYVVVSIEGLEGEFKATTNISLTNFGNLSDLFESID